MLIVTAFQKMTRTILIVFGIDTSSRCGPSCNVDFVRLIWQNFEQFAFKKYSITLLPSEDASDPKIFYLKYYKAESDRLKESAHCFTCRLDYRQTMQGFAHCKLPAD